MSSALILFAAFAGSFFIGSVPFAVIVSKAMGLQDPRTFGSGNPGATNVLRSGSKAAAVLTLLGDAGKGLVAVLVVSAWVKDPRFAELFNGWALSVWMIAVAALGSFLGHVYSFFLKLKGGKGVATAAGVMLGLDWRLGLGILLLWVAVAFITRYSSLGALCAAIAAPIAGFWLWGATPTSYALVVMCVVLFVRHHANIKKLLNGTESKLGGPKKA